MNVYHLSAPTFHSVVECQREHYPLVFASYMLCVILSKMISEMM